MSPNWLFLPGSNSEYAHWKIDKHGLKCGWFGNKALLLTEKGLKKKEDYDAFFKYGTELANELDEKIKNATDESTGKKVGKAASIVGIAAWIYVPFIGIPGVVNLAVQNSKKNKKIKGQQYDTLVRDFYLNYCKSFIEGNL